jgi:signal transduction histidine kinase
MNAGIAFSVFATVIAGLFFLFTIRHAAAQRLISDYTRTLDSINGGNFNRRFRCRPAIRGLIEFTRAANLYTEQLQRLTAEKQHMERAQNAMISNISHDLRTPLTSILGYVQALQTDTSLSDRDRTEYLSIIGRKSESLYLLMESFFELSKIDADTAPIPATKININEETENALSALYREFREKGIEPVIDIPAENLLVWGNRGYIQRILDNLLINAIRHGAHADEIGVSARREGVKIIVSVWDTGDGIEEKDLPFIFDRLYVSDESRKRKPGGSGLGLAIAKRLVERLGGEIEAKSECGVRTEITFTLPAALTSSGNLQ